ncbi:MAG: hypothetical protein NTY74_00115 [Ignavibacteriae bacterium]|nr:hypothetical protein [Ignavibacteriota bacterium]
MKFAKLLSVVLFAVMLLTSVSYGQSISSGTARYEALGYNPFIKDASIDINRNPAWTTVYRNYTFGDIGRNAVGTDQYQLTDQFGAVNFGVSKDVALGLVLNKYEDNWTDFPAAIDTVLGIKRPVVPLKITLGWQMSPKFALGFAPYYAAWSSEQQFTAVTDITKLSSSSLGATVGLLSKLENGWIEGAVDAKFNSYKSDVTVGTTNTVQNNQGGMNLSFFTRGFFLINKSMGLNLVPYLAFSTSSWNPIAVPTSLGYPDNQFSTMNLGGGIGVNMPVFDNGLLAGGLSFGYSSLSDKSALSSGRNITNTAFVLPAFNLGLEWPFTDWMTGRVGYSRAVASVKNNVETTIGTAVTTYTKGTAVSSPDQTITTGLGFHFNRFSIDGTVGEKLFKDGFYIVTGKINELFGMLSASYNFGK